MTIPYNIKYLLETYETPDGKYVCAELSEYLNGKHFSPELIRFILYQHHHCGVTQPLLLEQLHEFDIDISKGQLNSKIGCIILAISQKSNREYRSYP